MIQSHPRERGSTLIIVSFVSAFLLIPIIGTCIDGAVLYWVKARLSAAVDATALATGRALNVGNNSSQQVANATYMGQMYFAANFPAGLMRASVVGGGPTINITDSGLHVRTVSVTAAVTVPLYFMPILGYKNQVVSATGQATRRDANIMLVLDRSGSMNNNGSCSALIASAQNFVNQFVDGRDQIGLVTYQFTANLEFAPQLHFKSSTPSLNSTLSTLVCAGDTNTVEGLYKGYDQIQNAINQPGALNVILLFTDGQSNAFTGYFEIKDQPDNRYDIWNTNQIVYTPASNCAPGSGPGGTLTGVIGDASSETASDVYGLNQTGYTGGISPNTPVPLTQVTYWSVTTAPGCNFYQTQNVAAVRQDIKGLPIQDIHGNSTIDGGYLPLDYFPPGHPYAGYIRPDMPRDTRWAAMNAADSQAFKIRNDTTYTPVVFTIGLQGNEPMAIDQDFMERMANDPRASNYDSTKQTGKFILATNTGELSQAFQQIASQILRLSR